MTDILHDKREIESIWYEPDGEYTVGSNGITKIEVYGEHSECCLRPWFKLWRNHVFLIRVNGCQLAGIRYKVE